MPLKRIRGGRSLIFTGLRFTSEEPQLEGVHAPNQPATLFSAKKVSQSRAEGKRIFNDIIWNTLDSCVMHKRNASLNRLIRLRYSMQDVASSSIWVDSSFRTFHTERL